MSDKHPKCGNCGKLIYDYYLRWSDQDGVRTHFHESDGECVENLKAQLEAVRPLVEAAEKYRGAYVAFEGMTVAVAQSRKPFDPMWQAEHEAAKTLLNIARQSPPPSEEGEGQGQVDMDEVKRVTAETLSDPAGWTFDGKKPPTWEG